MHSTSIHTLEDSSSTDTLCILICILRVCILAMHSMDTSCLHITHIGTWYDSLAVPDVLARLDRFASLEAVPGSGHVWIIIIYITSLVVVCIRAILLASTLRLVVSILLIITYCAYSRVLKHQTAKEGLSPTLPPEAPPGYYTTTYAYSRLL